MGRRVSRKTKEEMTTVEVEVGGKKITLETGRLAKQANGAVLVRCGDEDHRVAAAHEYCSVGLLGQPAGLEGDLLAPDLYFYCSHLFLRLPTDPAPHCAQVLSRPWLGCT